MFHAVFEMASTFANSLNLDGLAAASSAGGDGTASGRNGPRHFLAMVMLCGILVLDTYHLLFMILGAVFFWALQNIQPDTSKKQRLLARNLPSVTKYQGQLNPRAATFGNRSAGHLQGPRARQQLPAIASERRDDVAPRAVAAAAAAVAQPKPEPRRPAQSASVPVAAPTFNSKGWDAEVEELVTQISPTAACIATVDHLVRIVIASLRQILPEVEVVGFANGDLRRGKAFGVAVPNVDLVVSVSLHALVRRLQGRFSSSRSASGGARLDVLKLQKSAIRAFTEQLVWGGGFKFRRSAFRGLDPKVTLLSPAPLPGFEEGIPIDIYANALTPLYSASLLAEVGSLDPRARELILLVRRWSKDRGVCHAAKGHLSPYVWNLLTIYFLQVGLEGSILPPLDALPLTSGLAQHVDATTATRIVAASKAAACMPPTASRRLSTGVGTSPMGTLFREFFSFYVKRFDWRNEVISIRHGRRSSPDLRLPLHVIASDGSTNLEVAPIIEDPFETRRNLGACMTSISFKRLRDELARAEEICNRGGGTGASLSELLRPWTPPEHDQDVTCEPEDDRQDGGFE